MRLGLRQIEGLANAEVDKMLSARTRLFHNPQDLQQRAGLRGDTLERLAAADAMRSMGLDRRQALWAVKGLVAAEALPLFAWRADPGIGAESHIMLPDLPLSEHVVTKAIQKRHPDLVAAEPCPNTERIGQESLWLSQTVLLADERDLADISEAIRKVQKAFHA